MKSNFEFLNQDRNTQMLYDTARDAEDLYAMGKFSNEFESIRKVAENVARQILELNSITIEDQNSFNDCLRMIRNHKLVNQDILNDFYSLKGIGNIAAHTLQKHTKEEALGGLIKLHDILIWYVNNYMNEKQKASEFVEPRHESLFQTTAERKLIYIQTADNSNGLWPAYRGLEKIGDTKIDSIEMDNRPNSDDLRKAANHRIRQYMETAGVPHKLQWAELAFRKKDKQWFRDQDVHEVLRRSGIKKKDIVEGQEWFEVDVDTAKKAIQAVKDGRKSLDFPEETNNSVKIVLRPEQKEAISKTKLAFKHNDKMLWNAKMRFGKTLSALQLIKEQGYQHVLIMTHRPIVDDGWFEDFKKIGMPEAGYIYGSKNEGEDFSSLNSIDNPFVYFASLQDLRGSEAVGGTAGDKNRSLFATNWDLVIVDEAHEGTQTELAKRVTRLVVKEGRTKVLELSGTPFNILDQYNKQQVYTWDYVMEQEAKNSWEEKHPNTKNPYDGLPKVSMYTFEMRNNFNDQRFNEVDKKSFNFREFFRVDDTGHFVYERKVRQFLDNITSPDSRTHYPFSTREFRGKLRHTLWLLPGVKEANALEDLMKKHSVFGQEYNIVNVVRDGDNEGVASENDIERVEEAIGEDAAATKTITLTVRKMTTGVTIKPWTGVMFLSNTNSAMQYLQAAFRAQTPYSSLTFGQKTNCYIFDFAPDRALTVIAESMQLNTGVGKRTNGAQKEKMKELMNFLPIIGETGQGMKAFSVDTLLAKVKRVYAEKAVRTGFEDSSLYSDELLMLKTADLRAFNKLKAIVGVTKTEKKPMKVNVNDQGLTDEEYKKATHVRNKVKSERTPEEQALIDKMKELKKQRKTMISILRSISIRIPMMIYGMDVNFEEDVNIRKFVTQVDTKSWKEFMPKGVTKELFREFSKYYDQDVFIEAGKIIRQKVKRLDTLDPIERTEQLADIFGTFRNPSKETVLTPWRVINMQLAKTLGGLSFYDEKYEYTTIDGNRANHWLDTNYTNKVFNPDCHILEINAKTGLYPLYAAMSLYWSEYQELNRNNAGKFSFEDELYIWQKILHDNIFIVAQTPMAAAITRRTLAGYRHMNLNIVYIDNMVEDSKNDVNVEAKKVRRLFGNMKFDVVIGNPPYQENRERTSDRPIYPEFMDLSYTLAPLVILITPARFLFNAGKTSDLWNKKMLNDEHLRVVKYFPDSTVVFPRVSIKGGVVITLRDEGQTFGAIKSFVPIVEMNSIMKKVVNSENFESLRNYVYAPESYKFTQRFHQDNPNATDVLSKGHSDDVTTNIFDKLPKVFLDTRPSEEYISIIGRQGNNRRGKYIRQDYIRGPKNFGFWKLLLPKANGKGEFGELLSSPIIEGPFVGHTQTFISIGCLRTEFEARSLLKYVKSKFLRALLGSLKVTQDNKKAVWQNIPVQNLNVNSDIDWSSSVSDIDQQLYRKYSLNQTEIDFIETRVKAMR